MPIFKVWDGTTFVEISGGGLHGMESHTDVSFNVVAKGELLVFDGSDWVDLAAGPSNYYLKTNSATPTGLEWVTRSHAFLNSDHHSDTQSRSVVRGALIVGDASAPAKWTRLAIGDAGKYLRSGGSDPSWAAITESDISDLSHFVAADLGIADHVIPRGDADGSLQDSSASIADNGVMSVPGIGTGGYTDYDLLVGNVTTPDYGMIRIGNASLGRTSFKAGAMDLDGTMMFRQMSAPATGKIAFIFVEAAGDSTRFAIPVSGVGYATYSSRSGMFIGPAPANTDLVDLLYWQALGWFLNLQCDTSGSGADLGVQNDLEVNGKIWVDEIEESTPAAGLKLQPGAGGDVVLFGGTDVADAADGKSLYVHRRAVEGDNSLRLYIADDRTAQIVANTDIILDPTNAGAHSSVSIENSDGTYKGGLKVEGCAGVGRKDHGTVSSSPLSINWLEGNLQTMVLGINLTINFGTAPLVPTTGMAVCYLKITNGAGTAYTVTFGDVDGWGSQETFVMSTGLGDIDIITIYYDGTNYWAVPYGQNFG